MKLLDKLLEGGPSYKVKLNDGGASFKPVSRSEEDIIAFQLIVKQIEKNDGDGYTVHIKHQTSERGRGLIDLVLIEIG